MTAAAALGVFKNHSRARAPLVAALAVCGGLGAGSVTAAEGHQLIEHLALGAGLRYFNFDLEDHSNTHRRGKFGLDYFGATVFAAINL